MVDRGTQIGIEGNVQLNGKQVPVVLGCWRHVIEDRLGLGGCKIRVMLRASHQLSKLRLRVVVDPVLPISGSAQQFAESTRTRLESLGLSFRREHHCNHEEHLKGNRESSEHRTRKYD